ncbi:MAG: D-Ala-D-Ala carboxypeptidase family metallohydrolase [Verrucomicrobiota bacterium]
MPDQNADQSSPETFKTTRRRTLGMIGGSGLALLGSTTPASAFIFGKRGGNASLDYSRLPAEWVKRQGSNLKGYANFLAGLRMKRVTPQQVIEAHAKRRGSVWNSLPPKKLWKNMAPTLKVVDRMAIELGLPVKEIVSAYRSPAYNARCAGARRGSWHQANVAVDVKFPVRASIASAKARSLRKRGHYRGGVGHYYGFTHVDTRGQNVDW